MPNMNFTDIQHLSGLSISKLSGEINRARVVLSLALAGASQEFKAGVLNGLGKAHRNIVARRIEDFQGTSPEVIQSAQKVVTFLTTNKAEKKAGVEKVIDFQAETPDKKHLGQIVSLIKKKNVVLALSMVRAPSFILNHVLTNMEGEGRSGQDVHNNIEKVLKEDFVKSIEFYSDAPDEVVEIAQGNLAYLLGYLMNKGELQPFGVSEQLQDILKQPVDVDQDICREFGRLIFPEGGKPVVYSTEMQHECQRGARDLLQKKFEIGVAGEEIETKGHLYIVAGDNFDAGMKRLSAAFEDVAPRHRVLMVHEDMVLREFAPYSDVRSAMKLEGEEPIYINANVKCKVSLIEGSVFGAMVARAKLAPAVEFAKAVMGDALAKDGHDVVVGVRRQLSPAHMADAARMDGRAGKVTVVNADSSVQEMEALVERITPKR